MFNIKIKNNKCNTTSRFDLANLLNFFNTGYLCALPNVIYSNFKSNQNTLINFFSLKFA